MADSLKGVVGLAGQNTREDVLKVQKLLNQIPMAQGGQGVTGGRGKLPEDGICLTDAQTGHYTEKKFAYDKTVLAICKFQMQHFKCVSGQVNPDSVTWSKMQQLTGGKGTVQFAPTDVLAALAMQGRDEIAKQALAEAAKDPVSDAGCNCGTPRKGGAVLKDYYDKATRNAINWTGKGKIIPNGSKDNKLIEITNLDGVMKSCYRVPQGDTVPDGLNWCGVFASYILQQAGLPIYWKMGEGLRTRNQRLPIFSDLSLLSKGDVLVLKGNKVHHVIYLGEVGDKIEAVEGNTNNQRVIHSHRWARNDISYFYCTMAGQDM